MSKLLDKLEQISRGNSKPLGFAAAAARSKLANMVIIADVGDNGKATAVAADYADAIIVNSIDGKPDAAKGKLPWGAPANDPTALKESGCDFILMNTEDSPVALLQEEKAARVIEIDPALPDGLLRSLNQIPADMALVSGDITVSMKRLLICQHIANMVGKHLLIRIPLDISREELRELWEIGAAGIVVPFTGDDKKGLAALREAVDALPSSRRKRSVKSNATIPSVAPTAPAEYQEPDEEDE